MISLPSDISDELLLAEWAVEDCENLYHFSKNTLDLGKSFREAGAVDKLQPRPHADLCDFLTNTGKYAGRLKNNWKLILLPRGTLKTSIGSIALPLQLLCRNSNQRILLDGETYSKSADTLRAIKGVITTNEKFRMLHGIWNEPQSNEAQSFVRQNRAQLTWNEDAIVIGTRTNFSLKEPSITVGGTEGVKVGMHYDIVIGDDYHSEKNVTTQDQINKVIQHIQLMISILDPGAQYIIIGTRWDDKDAYGWIIDEIEGIPIREPGVYGGRLFDIMVYPWKWQKSEGSDIYFAPQILNEESIVPIKEMQSAYHFSCQYLNDPVDKETAIFKESWLHGHVMSPKEVEPMIDSMVKFTCVDPSMGKTADSDWTAIVTVGFVTEVGEDALPDIKRVLLDVNCGRWNPDQMFEEIVSVYRKWRPLQVGFEAVSGFETFQHIFTENCRRRGVFIPFNYFKRDSRISKETRIRALAPLFRSGTFYLVRGARGLSEFHEEYRRYPKGKHDDVLDALADVEKFAYFPMPQGQKANDYVPNDNITGY